MNISDFNLTSEKIAIFIGGFDPVLKENITVFKELHEYSISNNLFSCIGIFDPHPFTLLDHTRVTQIESYDFKKKLLKSIGIKVVFKIEFKKSDLEMDAKTFLNELTNRTNISCLWISSSQSFGSGPSGSQNAINSYCKSRNINLKKIPAKASIKRKANLAKKAFDTRNYESLKRIIKRYPVLPASCIMEFASKNSIIKRVDEVKKIGSYIEETISLEELTDNNDYRILVPTKLKNNKV